MNYLRVFFLTMSASMALVGSINWFVDPYGMYWSPLIEGLNFHKVEAGDRGLIIKPKRVKAVKPETVLIGNSRVEMGISASSPLFTENPVYNLGIPGINLEKQYKFAMQQLSDNPNLRTMLLSVDYLDYLFMPERMTALNDSYSELTQQTSEWQSIKQQSHDYLSLLLSLNTLYSSFKTIVLQNSQSNHIDKFGTNIADGYHSIMRTEGLGALFRQKLDEVEGRLARSEEVLFINTLDENPGFRWLATLIGKAKEKKIELVIFTNPYHYSYLQVINQAGHWDSFIQWKQGLAKLSLLGVTIFDFSGFNAYTAEEVDLLAPHKSMSWYWEPAHYNSKLGEKMLEIMSKDDAPVTFGRHLNTERIDSIIQDDNAGLEVTKSKYYKLRESLQLD